MDLLITNTSNNNSKLTLTKDEIRLKLSGDAPVKHKEKLIEFTKLIINNIEKSYLCNTLRGKFQIKEDQIYIHLCYNHSKVKRKGVFCVLYFPDTFEIAY